MNVRDGIPQDDWITDREMIAVLVAVFAFWIALAAAVIAWT